MTTNKTIGLFLLATTFLSSPAGAAALTPTPDTIKSEAAGLSGNFALSELTGDLPAGAVEVKIGDKNYYLTPSGDDAALLATLAGTSDDNLKEDANGIFELNGQKYGFNVSLLKGGNLTYEKGSADDHDFSLQTLGTNGKTETAYYKFDFKFPGLESLNHINWQEVGEDKKDDDNVIALKLSDKNMKYYQFSYNQPQDFTIVADKSKKYQTANPADLTEQAGGSALNNTGNGGSVVNQVFKNNSVTAQITKSDDSYKYYFLQGGAIYNSGTIDEINADFIGNSVKVVIDGSGSHQTAVAQGGAIFNKGTVGNITGDFINNEGSAIYNFGFHGTAVIGNITGNFIGNSGSAIVNRADNLGTGNSNTNVVKIGNISGNFVNNTGSSGGAIDHSASLGTATVGSISGNFIGNRATTGDGGAVYFGGSGQTGSSISGIFINNSAEGTGGALYGSGHYDVYADFIGNTAEEGGAVYGWGAIGSLNGNFINNSSTGRGGAIWKDHGSVENLTGDFINNHSDAIAGAIGVDQAEFNNITGNFINNSSAIAGAILNTPNSVIGSINGSFYGNASIDNGIETGMPGTAGGAIINIAQIGNINGDFSGNYAKAENTGGGAIFNVGLIGDLTGNFVGNYAEGEKTAAGGAIADLGVLGMFVGSDSPSALTVNGSFANNCAKAADGIASGGAIAAVVGYAPSPDGESVTAQPVRIQTRNKDLIFSGNYTEDSRGKIYNALSVVRLPDLIENMLGSQLGEYNSIEFDTTGGGSVTVNDTIDTAKINIDLSSFSLSMEQDYSKTYNLLFKGDAKFDEYGLSDQYVAINNDVVNAGKVTVEGTTLRFGAYQHEDKTANNWNGRGAFKPGSGTEAVTSLSLNNAAFDIADGYTETVNLKGYNANNSYLHIDIDPDNMSADLLNINGNVEGQTKLVVYSSSQSDIRGKGSVLFAQSVNDTTGNKDSFSIFRVYGSPYMYEIAYTQTGENQNQWGLTMGDVENPDKDIKPEKPGQPDLPDIPDPDLPDIPDLPTIDGSKVAPEVVAMGALSAAAIEQTRSVVDNVTGQTIKTEADHNLWINPTYYTSNIDSPFDVDADVWGIEAGGDLQHDLNNKLGLFVSYRKGSYDMNGRGKHYYSTVGSEIDIDSYLAGLYYRYDRNNWYAFATLYGGIQQADIKTDDGIKSDTDGVEFGASLEAGYDYNLTDTVYLTPSLGVFYTQVNYDDATDSVGKKAEYNDLKQIELEAGVKLTKAFRLDEGYANVYVKPSVVQTLVDGDEVNITGLGKVNTLDDETLGRIELGGRYGFTDQLSAYGWANYTFGSDYDATTVGLGLNYAF